MSSVDLIIPIRPKPAPRPRAQPGGGRSYNPTGYKDWLDAVATYTKIEMLKQNGPLSGPVIVNLDLRRDVIALNIIETTTAHRHGLRGDIDNYAKAVLDGIDQGGVFAKSDNQVVGLNVRMWEA